MSEYSFVAATYDLFLTPFLSGMRNQVLSSVDSIKPERIIDLCCGTGHQLKLLKKHGYTNVSGVDLSSDMLAIAAKGRYSPACYERDAADTHFNDSTFDLAMVSLALHEKTREKALSVIDEAYRILKPEGSLLVSDFTADGSARKYASAVIRFIESMAGGEHYANFKEYMKRGGFDDLFDSGRFKKAGCYKIAAGGIAVSIWKILKD